MPRKALMTGLLYVLLIGQIWRADAAGLGCVMLGNGAQLNLDTGQVQAVLPPLNTYDFNAISPDNHLQAYLQVASTDNNAETHFSLQLIDQANHIATIREVTLQIEKDIQFAWSASGMTLFYLWKTPENEMHAGASDRTGHELGTTMLQIQVGDEVSFAQNSATDEYLILRNVHKNNAHALIFLALPSLTRPYVVDDLAQDSPLQCYLVRGCSTWSAQTLNFAFGTKQGDTNQLIIISPDAQSKRTFNLAVPLSGIYWSPDGKYLAMRQHRADSYELTNLSVLTLATGKWAPISDKAIFFGGGEGVEYDTVFWSTDSKVLLYAQNNVSNPDLSSPLKPSLFAYSTQTGQFTKLSSLASEPNYDMSHSYAIVAESVGSTAQFSLLNTHTGQKKRLFSSNNAALNSSDLSNYTQWLQNNTLAFTQIEDKTALHLVWADTQGTVVKQFALLNQRRDFNQLSSIGRIEPPASMAKISYGRNNDTAHWGNFSDDASQRLVYTQGLDNSGCGHTVWLLKFSTADAHKLDCAVNYFNVFFSPDETLIAMSSINPDSKQLASHLRILSADGKRNQIKELQSSIGAMGWSPDSKMLIYWQQDTQVLQIVAANGSSVRTIGPDSNINYLNAGQEITWTALCKPALANP